MFNISMQDNNQKETFFETRHAKREHTPKHGLTVKMLRSVFEKSISVIVVLHEVNWQCLESSPPKRNYDRVSCFQYLFVPSMFLESSLTKK